MGAERGYGLVRHRFFQWCLFLFPELWQRRYVCLVLPSESIAINSVSGSANVATWNFRACVIQGTQQIYVAVLWYWGSGLMKMTVDGVTTSALVQYGRQLTAITTPIAILMWAVAIVLFLGLPDYYRQTPGQVPSFYKSIMRRKIILVSPRATLLSTRYHPN